MKRITARVRHGRRQQHINLPPSGLGGIGHGEDASPTQKEQRERDKLKAEEREARLLSRRIVTDIYHNSDNALKRSMARAGIDEEQDLISRLIHGADRLTDKQLESLLRIT
ncbi:hypothetical protein [Pseudomonas putida]|uniref:hypothetical protein n=1 Tax=Pseudomonas putida TaxID=303 RepID=UPI0002EDCA9A|nr:hypothetical protein [Pseudomonas putida]